MADPREPQPVTRPEAPRAARHVPYVPRADYERLGIVRWHRLPVLVRTFPLGAWVATVRLDGLGLN